MPDFTLTGVVDIEGIEIVDVKFPSPVRTKHAENDIVHGLYFKAAGKRDFSTVILLHGWGRSNLWKEKKIAIRLARNNINCFILKLPYHFERTPEGTWSGEYAITGDILRTVEGTRQLVIEVRTVSSWLRRQVEKVVISGISLGGMMAHLAMAAEAFDAGITILAGGNNAGIIWEGIATRSVKDDLINAGFTREQTSHIYQIINPCIMAKHNKTKNLLMINGLYDEVMPGRFTMELWEALGRPRIKWYPCAHVTSVLFVKNIIKDMIRFIHGDMEINLL
jgi:dienelactone hydrolase